MYRLVTMRAFLRKNDVRLRQFVTLRICFAVHLLMKLNEWKLKGQQQEVKKNDQQQDGDRKMGLCQEVQ
jgi:hypothetical protein